MLKRDSREKNAKCQANNMQKCMLFRYRRYFRRIIWKSTKKWDCKSERVKAYKLHQKQPPSLAITLIIIHKLFSYHTCCRRFYYNIGDIPSDVNGVVKATRTGLISICYALIRQIIDMPALIWSALKTAYHFVKEIAKLKFRTNSNNRGADASKEDKIDEDIEQLN